VLLSLAIGITTAILVLRQLRKQDFEPKYLPGKWLKRKWKNWNPGKKKYNALSRTTIQQELSHTRTDRTGDISYQGAGTSIIGVDRNTSVRSVMTLPVYSQTPKPTEQVIGREGERAGMDVVVEFPETNDDEEARREEEMESLYQIRLARRREQEEREERRRERREARTRGDTVRLQQLRHEREERARAEAVQTAAMLLAEHRSRGRDRRVSSVSYAAVGHVRHDGTRVRAGSRDSDSIPLLDNASSMSIGDGTSLSTHHRAASGSSLLSQSTTASDHDIHPTLTIDTEFEAADTPPQYDQIEMFEAPPYPEPAATRDMVRGNQPPQLPPIDSLPVIAIETATPPITPVSPVAPTSDGPRQ
jgi:hypothetical protein